MKIITNALINSIFDGSIHTNLPSDLIDFCSLSILRPFCSIYLWTMMITTYNSTICRYIYKQHKCRSSKLVFPNVHHHDWLFRNVVILIWSISSWWFNRDHRVFGWAWLLSNNNDLRWESGFMMSKTSMFSRAWFNIENSRYRFYLLFSVIICHFLLMENNHAWRISYAYRSSWDNCICFDSNVQNNSNIFRVNIV